MCAVCVSCVLFVSLPCPSARDGHAPRGSPTPRSHLCAWRCVVGARWGHARPRGRFWPWRFPRQLQHSLLLRLRWGRSLGASSICAVPAGQTVARSTPPPTVPPLAECSSSRAASCQMWPTTREPCFLHCTREGGCGGGTQTAVWRAARCIAGLQSRQPQQRDMASSLSVSLRRCLASDSWHRLKGPARGIRALFPQPAPLFASLASAPQRRLQAGPAQAGQGVG